jgi:hypothetical protein
LADVGVADVVERAVGGEPAAPQKHCAIAEPSEDVVVVPGCDHDAAGGEQSMDVLFEHGSVLVVERGPRPARGSAADRPQLRRSPSERASLRIARHRMLEVLA